ncbi:MAG: hypothetical protein QMD22_04705 [archaeon]|nr:hypothetical protein [archaeon]
MKEKIGIEEKNFGTVGNLLFGLNIILLLSSLVFVGSYYLELAQAVPTHFNVQEKERIVLKRIDSGSIN